MVDQFSIEKKHNQGIKTTFELGGNAPSIPRRLERQISLSGPNSEGEKSLLKKDPSWLVSPKTKIPVFNSCLCSLDELVATPSINVSVIESACDKDFKFFDAINNSKFVGLIDGGLVVLGVCASFINIYVIKYCTLREAERNSNYFYFYQLSKLFNEEIKKKLDKIDQYKKNSDYPITYPHLITAAHFNPNDIPKIACFRRRLFASKEERKQLNDLNELLKKYSNEEILKIISEQVCGLLNHEVGLNIVKIKEDNNNCTIGLTENYAKSFFNHVYPLIAANAETTLKEIKRDKRYKRIIASIFSALAQSSFIYWILLFIFYFIPIAPVVTAALISVIPLGISLCVALPLLLIINLINTNQTFNINQNMKKETIETQHKDMLEKKIVLLTKQIVFLKFQERKAASSTVVLKNSLLMKKLQAVINNRRYSKYHAICLGFLEGCFLPLFLGWVFFDATKVILTYALCPSTVALTSFTPIGLVVTAIITGVTLLIGMSYGVYLAVKAKKAHEKRFDDLENKIKLLVDERGNTKILQEDYDRMLRRFSDEKPFWTNIKKGLNRSMTIIKRLGTGSLVFRLVMWGPITSIYAAIVASSAVPAFFPIILIVGTALGALAIASWYLFAYNLESKTTQVERVMEYFVQSEQLIEINKELSVSLLESLETQESSLEVLMSSSKNLVVSENDTPFRRAEISQENISSANEDSNLENIDEMTTQTETARQRSNSASCSHGLFKVNHIGEYHKSGRCLSPAMVS
ncbi:hypothetical protein [Rickettsiella endosymbiont of Xylota segnis]|uniref:hypothetical protein n=1 Tax=Rickettsiella endosymbiont of Xylota segnis TaxID=3066238 RepID=UPI0030D2E3DE